MIHGAKGGSMKMKYMAAWCKLLGFFFYVYIILYYLSNHKFGLMEQGIE